MTATNNYKKWTKDDDDYLSKKLAADCKPSAYVEIADKLQRTVDAVQARFVKKCLVTKYTQVFLYKSIKQISELYNIDRKDLIRYLKYSGLKCYDEHDEESKEATSDDDTSDTYDDITSSSEDQGDDDIDGSHDTSDDESGTYTRPSLKVNIDIELNMVHIAMISSASLMLYYLYPIIIRSI